MFNFKFFNRKIIAFSNSKLTDLYFRDKYIILIDSNEIFHKSVDSTRCTLHRVSYRMVIQKIWEIPSIMKFISIIFQNK